MATGAIRIEFAGNTKDGPDHVEDVRPVDIRALPSDPLQDFSKRSGMWIELRDAGKKVIYRRVMHDGTLHIEGPQDEDSKRVKRGEPNEQRFPSLHVVVPKLANAQTAVLVRSRGPGRRAEDAISVTL